jgi:hypothetical protein
VNKHFWLVGALMWVLFSIGGSAWLWRYSLTAAPAAEPPLVLPAQFRGDSTGPVILMFAHPQCPCTIATLEQLDKLTARSAKVTSTIIVFFVQPRDRTSEWVQSGSWQRATRIPHIRVIADPDGRSAAQFGVHASGHTLVYGGNGELRFSGGLTPSRGHVGDAAGLTRAAAAVMGSTSLATAPVFGCALLEHGGRR